MKIVIFLILLLHSLMYLAIGSNPQMRHLKGFAYILALIVLAATAYQGNEVYSDYKQSQQVEMEQ